MAVSNRVRGGTNLDADAGVTYPIESVSRMCVLGSMVYTVLASSWCAVLVVSRYVCHFMLSSVSEQGFTTASTCSLRD